VHAATSASLDRHVKKSMGISEITVEKNYRDKDFGAICNSVKGGEVEKLLALR